MSDDPGPKRTGIGGHGGDSFGHPPDDQERRAQAARDLFQAADTSAQLRLVADRHLAALIEEHLMPDLDMTEPAYSLLDEIVMRLDPSTRV